MKKSQVRCYDIQDCKLFATHSFTNATLDEVDHEEMKTMKKELDHLNCNKATNAEICHLVASFFTVLDSNEGDNFQLVYDDLPIYYVPERLKERLYLMSNLFTK